ncbi:MAG: hypothetical protein HQ564_09990 [Candidatus Saganbacteria bacterium]|nr:hypothetical protein [Candidatus Saganbacteria bacterium]
MINRTTSQNLYRLLAERFEHPVKMMLKSFSRVFIKEQRVREGMLFISSVDIGAMYGVWLNGFVGVVNPWAIGGVICKHEKELSFLPELFAKELDLEFFSAALSELSLKIEDTAKIINDISRERKYRVAETFGLIAGVVEGKKYSGDQAGELVSILIVRAQMSDDIIVGVASELIDRGYWVGESDPEMVSFKSTQIF